MKDSFRFLIFSVMMHRSIFRFSWRDVWDTPWWLSVDLLSRKLVLSQQCARVNVPSTKSSVLKAAQMVKNMKTHKARHLPEVIRRKTFDWDSCLWLGKIVTQAIFCLEGVFWIFHQLHLCLEKTVTKCSLPVLLKVKQSLLPWPDSGQMFLLRHVVMCCMPYGCPYRQMC